MTENPDEILGIASQSQDASQSITEQTEGSAPRVDRQLVASGGLLVIELGAGAEAFAIESGKALVRSIIGAAIWIPYFRVSKRVKATFVN